MLKTDEINQDESRWEGLEIHDSVAIVSGGLDSTTLVYEMLDRGWTPHLLSFNYGQRHSKELAYARMTARTRSLRHSVIDLTGITYLISNSALTSPAHNSALYANRHEIEVPEGHYAEENMKATVVPNRNMIMLSIAAGVAVNYKYKTIGIGVHGGDHFVYPDCRPTFLDAASDAIWLGNQGFHGFGHEVLYAPFLNKTKADIAYRAIELGVPLHMTWSCYKGGDKHCGRCGTCVERLEAIDEAQERFKTADTDWRDASWWDHTEYEDTEFWRTAVAQSKNS